MGERGYVGLGCIKNTKVINRELTHRSSNVSPPTVEAVLYCFNVGMASTDFTVHEATMMQAAASATPKLSKVDDGCGSCITGMISV